MLKKIKNMDPMTKQFAVAAAIHVTTIVGLCTAAVILSKKNENSSEN